MSYRWEMNSAVVSRPWEMVMSRPWEMRSPGSDSRFAFCSVLYRLVAAKGMGAVEHKYGSRLAGGTMSAAGAAYPLGP
jgi:hypothetical protein